jgi:hypothetical protein
MMLFMVIEGRQNLAVKEYCHNTFIVNLLLLIEKVYQIRGLGYAFEVYTDKTTAVALCSD